MKIITTVREMQAEARRIRSAGRIIGFVPTMGFLHAGHLSLIRTAREKADIIVLSIYVNPTQFGPDEDLSRYPRDFDRDEEMARRAGVDILFYPSDSEIYPPGHRTFVEVEDITRRLCGASRPAHFRGVTTIVAKLFHAVQPHVAVFGQKDAQQAIVIRRMAKDLNFDVEIAVAPIVREPDGLAMSSRNTYLSPDERRDALALYESLRLAEERIRSGERNAGVIIESVAAHIRSKTHNRIDYVACVDAETLDPLETVSGRVLIALAVSTGRTRLIDNIILDV
ncbi:MAG TPA: pantoate--beta-alanine ligase [bacterium]|nr:pantoate--beta-alanine ligase [bacterium]